MSKIIGFGRAFPSFIRKNSAWSPELIASFQDRLKRDLLDITEHEINPSIDQFSLDNIEKEKSDIFLGASERRILDDNTPSYELEVEAAQIAIAQAGIKAQEIEGIFSYSFIPERIGLPSATMVSNRLGIKNAFGCQIETACSSQVLQLAMASAMVDTGKVPYMLLTASNIMSRGLVMGHPASPGVGDAATAIVLGNDSLPGHQIINTFNRTHGEYYNAVVWRRKQGESQNWMEPGSSFYLGSYDGNKARELVQITATVGSDTIKSALEEVDMSVNDLNFVTAVQPRKWINTAITRLLGLSDEQSIETYQQYAHLGCCGPVVNLIEANQQNLLHQGDIIALYAQGAGFTRSAAIIKW